MFDGFNFSALLQTIKHHPDALDKPIALALLDAVDKDLWCETPQLGTSTKNCMEKLVFGLTHNYQLILVRKHLTEHGSANWAELMVSIIFGA